MARTGVVGAFLIAVLAAVALLFFGDDVAPAAVDTSSVLADTAEAAIPAAAEEPKTPSMKAQTTKKQTKKQRNKQLKKKSKQSSREQLEKQTKKQPPKKQLPKQQKVDEDGDEAWPLSTEQEDALRRGGTEPRPQTRAQWDHLISTLQFSFGTEVLPLSHALGRVAVRRGVYLSEYQRPTVAHVPELTAKPWWNGGGGGFNENEGGMASLTRFSAALEAAPFLGALRRELDAVIEAGECFMPLREQAFLLHDGGSWSQCVLLD